MARALTWKQVRKRRKALRLSLDAFAERMGISGPYLSRVERGILSSPRLPDAEEVLEKLEKKKQQQIPRAVWNPKHRGGRAS